jgi:hypothetical protein
MSERVNTVATALRCSLRTVRGTVGIKAATCGRKQAAFEERAYRLVGEGRAIENDQTSVDAQRRTIGAAEVRVGGASCLGGAEEIRDAH